MTAGLFRIMIDQHLVTNFFFLTFMLRVNPDPVASEALAFVQHGDCFQGHHHLEIKLEPQDAYDAPGMSSLAPAVLVLDGFQGVGSFLRPDSGPTKT